MTSRLFCGKEVKVKSSGKTDSGFLVAKVFLRDRYTCEKVLR